MKIEVKAPNIATIAAGGPVQCGKSIVMLRLARLLEEDFGAKVILNDELQATANAMPSGDLKDWEKKLVRETVWVLAE